MNLARLYIAYKNTMQKSATLLHTKLNSEHINAEIANALLLIIVPKIKGISIKLSKHVQDCYIESHLKKKNQ